MLVDSVHLVETGHDAHGTLFDGCFVGWQVFFVEVLVCDGGVAAVESFVCSSVTDKVLERGDDSPIGVVVVALLPTDKCCSEVDGEFGGFTKTFINAAPALVLRDRDGGGKIQVDVRRPHFFGDGLTDFADKCSIAGGAEPDVVREYGGSVYVGDAVDVVLAVDDGDFVAPGFGVKIGCVCAAAFKRRAAELAAAGRVRGFGLRHLRYHVVNGHVRHESINSIFNGVTLQGDVATVLAGGNAECFWEESCFVRDEALSSFSQ